MKSADGADLLDWQMRAAGLPPFEREYRFAPPRLFRFDCCWPDRRLAVEVNGHGKGGHGGRHASYAGMRSDAEKSALAAIAGYRVITVTTEQVTSGVALQWVERALQGHQ